MQLRIPVTDLYAAPGFVGPEGDLALDATRLAELYSFLPAGSSSALEGGHLPGPRQQTHRRCRRRGIQRFTTRPRR